MYNKLLSSFSHWLLAPLNSVPTCNRSPATAPETLNPLQSTPDQHLLPTRSCLNGLSLVL